MVMAAESLGLGSVFLGNAPYQSKHIIKKYKLPPLVFPLVQLAMGYPAEDPPPRPRYPLEYTLFEDEYPEHSQEQLAEAMKVMDEGYLAQEYYRRANVMINLQGEREETFTFDDYSWTEHISRKWGQWFPDPDNILEQIKGCGFDLSPREAETDEQASTE